MDTICFAGSALEDIKRFPENAMREAGYQLDKVQRGLPPSDWKAMPSVGSGVTEIRIRDERGIFRVIYVSKYLDTVFVLHAFQKKSQKTSKRDLDIVRKRLKKVIAEVR